MGRYSMANKLAVYRQPTVQEQVQAWFNTTFQWERSLDIDKLFKQYVSFILDEPWEPDYLMGLEDFARTMYSLGIIDITEGGDTPIYDQLEEWRPSLDQIRRFKL